MTHREADGADKIAAFERGMSDERVALAFETPGVQAYIVDEAYLTAYSIDGEVLTEHTRLRLYGNDCSGERVLDFLRSEAKTFDCLYVAGPLVGL